MKKSSLRLRQLVVLLLSGFIMIFFFQNCSKVQIADTDEGSLNSATGDGTGLDTDPSVTTPTTIPGPTDPLVAVVDPLNPSMPVIPPVVSGCQNISCELTPLTTKPAVTTILLTLGDQSNSELVINGASSQFIAETVIRYSSPIVNPKILIVFDNATAGEDLEDQAYITNVLLARYQHDVITTSSTGLTETQTKNYDVIWYNNPGHPMSSQKTLATLLAFKGGVILQGDDLARGYENGTAFSLTALTGLKFIDNGVTVVCAGKSYAHDDNKDNQYRVSIDPTKIVGAESSALNFRYGNDIDNTTPASTNLDIIATAVGGPDSCTESRPTIVRYFK